MKKIHLGIFAIEALCNCTLAENFEVTLTNGTIVCYPWECSTDKSTDKLTHATLPWYGQCASDVIKEVVIPSGIIVIDQKTFRGYTNLTSVTIPQSVKAIGRKAFSGCENLTTVNIYSNEITIKEDAFSDCKNLSSVNIASFSATIGCKTFAWCENLQPVTFFTVVCLSRSGRL